MIKEVYKPERLVKLTWPGIFTYACGTAGGVYYWSAKARRFLHVQTVD